MMSKKIIILNGSPRAKGNTMGIIKAFTAGAEAAGHTVTRFDLQKMNIHPCIGCCQGGKDISSPCTQKDDMDKIAEIIAMVIESEENVETARKLAAELTEKYPLC